MVSLVYSSALAIVYLACFFRPGFLRNLPTWFTDIQSSSPQKSSTESAVHLSLFISLLDGPVLFYLISLYLTIRICRQIQAYDKIDRDYCIPSSPEYAYRIPRPHLMTSKMNDVQETEHQSFELTPLPRPCASSNCSGDCSGPMMSQSISRIHSTASPQSAYENRAFSMIGESVQLSPHNQRVSGDWVPGHSHGINQTTEALYARPHKSMTIPPAPAVYI